MEMFEEKKIIDYLDNNNMDEIIKPKGIKKNRIIILFTIIIIITIIVIRIKTDSYELKVFEDDFYKVRKGNIDEIVKLEGEVVNTSKYTLNTEISGYVKEVFVKEGDEVSTGDILCQIENTKYLEELKSLENKLKISRIKLKAYNIGIEKNVVDQEYAIYKKNILLKEYNENLIILTHLSDIGSISKNEMEFSKKEILKIEKELDHLSKKNSLENEYYKQQILIRELEITNYKLEIEKIEKQIQLSIIKAPFNGIIQKVFLVRGNYIQDKTLFCELEQNLMLDYICKVPISIKDLIRIGLPVEVELNNKLIKGRVKSISKLIRKNDMQSNYLEARIEIPEEYSNYLLSGMYFNVNVVVDKKEYVLIVPRAEYTSTSGFEYVFRVENEKEAVKTYIETGIYNEDYVEIVSGLKDGDIILISDYSKFFKLNKINFKKRKP